MNRKLALTQKADLTIGVFDSMNLISIFSLLLTEATARLLQEMARFALFPASVAFAGIRAILAIRQSMLTDGKHGTFANAVIETIGAIAIATATIGGFVAATAFSLASPIIMTVATAIKAAFHLGATIYYGAKGYLSKDPALKEENYNAALGHGIATIVLSLITVAVAMVMIAAKPLLGILAIVGGSIGMGYSIYHLVTDPAIPPAPPKPGYSPVATSENSEKPSPTNSAKLQQQFQPKAEVTPVATNEKTIVTKPLWQTPLSNPVIQPQTYHLGR